MVFQFLDGRVHGQYRKRQIVGDKTQHHQPIGVDEHDGAVDDVHGHQQIVDRAVGLDQKHPGIQTHQRVGPHGDHQQHDQLGRHIRGLTGDVIREGIPQQQAYHRGGQRHLEAFEDHLKIDGIQQRGIALRGKLIHHTAEGPAGHEADVDDEQKRHRHEQDHPQRHRACLCQRGKTPLFCQRGGAHDCTSASEASWMATP